METKYTQLIDIFNSYSIDEHGENGAVDAANQEPQISLDVDQYLHANLRKVDQTMISKVENYHTDLRSAVEIVVSAGGKKIRGKIILLIGKLLGADQQKLICLASSIELLHTATLVHDDFIDGGLLRRGMPTLNSKWSPAATILTGDFLFAAASDLASKTNSVGIMQVFSRTLMTIIDGEVKQLFLRQGRPSFESYGQLIYAKTASLFEASAQTAAMISEVEPATIANIRSFGRNLGMAFQIMDDVLDISGSETKLGKPLGSDIRQGLITLPVLHYLNLYPSDPICTRLLSRKSVKQEEDVNLILEKIRGSQALLMARDDARKFCQQAEKDLLNLPDRPERDALLEITRFVVEREK